MTQDQITDNDKLLAAVCYIFWPAAVFVLLSEENKKRPFQRYHAVQSLGFLTVAVVFIMVFGCCLAVSQMIHDVFACLVAPFCLIPAAIAIWFAYRAYQGEQFEVPYLTQFMKQQGWLA